MREITFQMEIHDPANLEKVRVPALMVGVFEGPRFPKEIGTLVDQYAPVKLDQLMESGEMQGKFKEFVMLHLPPEAPFQRILFMGMGKEEDFTFDILESIVAKATRTLRRGNCSEMAIMTQMFDRLSAEDLGRAVALGATLGLYRIRRYRKESSEEAFRGYFKKIVFLVSPETDREALARGCRIGNVLAQATNRARDIANEPACYMTPRLLAKRAEEVAKECDLFLEVFAEEDMKELGMGGILAVSAGSEEPARLIVLRYEKHPGAPRIGLVGKGVTFDSGGISLKPSIGMHQMKYDMAGAAAVIETVQAAAELDLPVNIVAAIPAAENLINGKAYKPGDVVKMYDGTYVEITNTDAEGRMLLADALAYVCEQDVDALFDIATLTGGCVIALGHIACGAMGNNGWLISQIIASSERTGEKVWPLPLFSEYKIQMKSLMADMINAGGRPASTITAGLFLKHFVNVPWVHLDVAGTAWIEEDSTLYLHKPYLPKRGATGFGVQTLTEICRILGETSGADRRKLQEFLAQDLVGFLPGK